MYISGPLFTEGERVFLEKVDRLCVSLGFQTVLPHRDVGFSSDRKGVFLRDKEKLGGCDAVVAVLNGLDVDSGTAWEIGYAYAQGKKVFGIYDDVRIREPDVQMNLMIYHAVEMANTMMDLRNKLRAIQKEEQVRS